jgi:hypothetical protein
VSVQYTRLHINHLAEISPERQRWGIAAVDFFFFGFLGFLAEKGVELCLDGFNTHPLINSTLLYVHSVVKKKLDYPLH